MYLSTLENLEKKSTLIIFISVSIFCFPKYFFEISQSYHVIKVITDKVAVNEITFNSG